MLLATECDSRPRNSKPREPLKLAGFGDSVLKGIRTPVSDVKSRSPGPLDDEDSIHCMRPSVSRSLFTHPRPRYEGMAQAESFETDADKRPTRRAAVDLWNTPLLLAESMADTASFKRASAVALSLP